MKPKERIAVIGGGSWGTTLANLLSPKAGRVSLWVYEEEICSIMKAKRENPIYLPGFPLADNIEPTSSLKEAVEGVRVVVSVVPSEFVRSVSERMAHFLERGVTIVSATKGIERETLKTMSQVFEETLPPSAESFLTILSGPSFAREVSMKKPTAVVVASRHAKTAREMQRLFNTPYFRIYTSDDVRGVELGGALKNVIALASGISDGLGFGNNARAALITRGLAEMVRLGTRMGANPQTFSGLAGLGDLVLTCSSDLSRNRTVGYRIGQGEKLQDILKEMKMVAEGVVTTLSMVGLGRRFGAELPIAEKVHSVLYEGVDPARAVEELMSRELKDEF